MVSLNTKPDRNLYRNTALIIYPDRNNYVVSNTGNTIPIAIISYRNPTSVTVMPAPNELRGAEFTTSVVVVGHNN